jgi:Ankyrin repeats (3 copies)
MQQYFERRREALFPGAHTSIAITCLTYLSFDVFARGAFFDPEELQSFLHDYIFLDYSAVYWGRHAHECSENLDRTLLIGYLQDNAEVTCASRILLKSYLYSVLNSHLKFLGMHVCAFFGLHHSLQILLEAGGKPVSQDFLSRTPLHWAAENGHDTVVKLLLAWDDIDVNVKDISRDTTLQGGSKRA